MRTSNVVTAFASFLAIFAAAPGAAQNKAAPPATQQTTVESAQTAPPKLIVAISVDQFSADLFSEYRPYFTGGLKRLSSGAVFPSAYQSHAATETCPGHSVLMTGMHPAHTGIIANRWFDLDARRGDKRIYCAEDENEPGSDSGNYTASFGHLLVPTLGERLKKAIPGAKNVAVSGKDRAALMMGGHDIDQVYWWDGKAFATLKGRALSADAAAENRLVAQQIARGNAGMTPPAYCASRNHAVRVSDDMTVGTYNFARPAGDAQQFRVSPALDAATLQLAAALVKSQKLGQDAIPDILSVSLSATDYVGHAFGTEGLEMCLQIAAVDQSLGKFFAFLDQSGIDYAVMLTADHGGHDLPERLNQQAIPGSARAHVTLDPAELDKRLRATLGFSHEGQVIYGDGPSGDMYISHDLTPDQRAQVLSAAKQMLLADDQVAAVLSGEELQAMPLPTGPVQNWTLAERARASFLKGRSGDFVVLLKPEIVSIPVPGKGYVATHGSPWDYDRRVPLLFWRKGMAAFEQPNPVMTVDIAPTLSNWIGLDYNAANYDGRCLDLDGGPGNMCKK